MKHHEAIIVLNKEIEMLQSIITTEHTREKPNDDFIIDVTIQVGLLNKSVNYLMGEGYEM